MAAELCLRCCFSLTTNATTTSCCLSPSGVCPDIRWLRTKLDTHLSPVRWQSPHPFTLELCWERLLVLLVLQRHRLRPLELFVHLVRHHAPVQDPAHHGEQQQTLEDPPLPPGANPVSHVGRAAPVRARKPRLCCGKLPTQLFFNPTFEDVKHVYPHSPSISTQKTHVTHNVLLARVFAERGHIHSALPVTSKQPLWLSLDFTSNSAAELKGKHREDARSRLRLPVPPQTEGLLPRHRGGYGTVKSSSSRQGLHSTFNFSYVSDPQLPPIQQQLPKEVPPQMRRRPAHRGRGLPNWSPGKSIKQDRAQEFAICSFPLHKTRWSPRM